jgi:RHS repeat-associated protein
MTFDVNAGATAAARRPSSMGGCARAMSRSRQPLVRATLAALGGLFAVGLIAQAHAQTVVRTVEFEYDAVTGQVKVERIQPGTAECLEKIYALDGYGNRTKTTTRPCGVVAEERAATSTFAAIADDTTTTTIPEAAPVGSYEDSTTNALNQKEVKRYDVRFGKLVFLQGPNALVTRWAFDQFGRPSTETRADGTSTVTEYVSCLGTPAPAGCLRETAFDTLPTNVSYASNKQKSQSGTAAVVEGGAIVVSLISAFYVQTTPRDKAGAQMGPRTQVHYDALGREIAKLSEGYDGRWSRTAVGYDPIGLKVAEYGPHWVVNDPAGTDRRSYRQWTQQRDIMQRPTATARATDLGNGAGIVELTLKTEYHGLEVRAWDHLNRQQVRRSNPAGQLAQTVDAYGATITQAYDGVGNLVRTRDALGNEVGITYTVRGQKSSLSDPDKGLWTYEYNAFGELIKQVSPNDRALAASTVIEYDKLGRIKKRLERTQTDEWVYDSCTKGVGKLCRTFNTAGFSQSSAYDALGRAWQTTTTLSGGITYTSSVTFDTVTGRVITQRYPSGFTVKYAYRAGTGFLNKVTNNATGAVYWSIDGLTDYPFDPSGKLIRQQFGNGVQTWNTYDRASGRALKLRAGANTTYAVQEQEFVYDAVDNLMLRQDRRAGLTESFAYDAIDRLTSHTVQSATTPAANATVNVYYNAIGNILWKDDVGAYTYTASGVGVVRPHAVQTARGTNFAYDANGNLASTSGAVVRTHVWSSFDLPLSMGMSGRSMAWVYGTDRQRVQNTITDGSVTRTIHYLHPDRSGGLFYERESSGSTIENRHFITAGGGVIGVVKTFGSNNATVAANPDHVNYWHKDHLGSLVAVSNANGAVLERMAYDAWGKRLFPNGTTDPNGQINPASTDRGYTGHEHLDELGFVHMNGRIYDPLLGRFLSPDPHIQDQALLQNYNRYSYVLNNPLRYTDPTGEWIQVLQAFALVIGAALADSNNKDLKIIGTLMMMAAMNGVVAEGGLLQAAAAGEAMISAVASFASAAIANTIAYGPEAGIKAGLFAAAFTGAGGIPGALSPERIIAHALLGCLQQATSGGKCGPGAAAAAFGKIATGVASEAFGLNDFGSKFAVTTVVGGTASVIGGGKFASGAAQAGFGYLFNAAAHDRQAGTTRAEIQGNYAASTDYCLSGYCLGVGYAFSPDALHLSVTIYDSYSGILTIDGQPRGCTSSLVCLNYVPVDGPKQERAVWGPFRLKAPTSMGNDSFAQALRGTAASWSNGTVPYRLDSTSNTFIGSILTPVYGAPQNFIFFPFQAPGYGGRR